MATFLLEVPLLDVISTKMSTTYIKGKTKKQSMTAIVTGDTISVNMAAIKSQRNLKES